MVRPLPVLDTLAGAALRAPSSENGISETPRLKAFDTNRNEPPCLSAAEKKSGASHKDSLVFFAITSPSVHSVQRPENINNLYSVERLDGKASGQTLTGLVAFSPAEAGH